MVVNDFDINRTGRPFRPFEANSPLVIDTNAELTLAIAVERFQPIASQRREIIQVACGFKPIKPNLGLTREARKFPNILTSPKAFRPVISEAHNHDEKLTQIMHYVKHKFRSCR